ncbi:uncharacterized protein LOC124115772 [Haliotis rufescens]|uniref:uncharacterized protein LOC124115772 n=1 Tax=Haliotis rufescens TaxID=6454 RepID=UPI001EB022FA|nr:uncharacterized protein LOC124115772 [Haliotis rufescens]
MYICVGRRPLTVDVKMNILILGMLIAVAASLPVKRNSEPLLISTFDWNHDGILDRREMRIVSAIMSAIFATPRRRIRWKMRRADRNHDGVLSAGEFNNMIESNFGK